MLDLGPHTGFIVAAYGAAALVVAAVIAWVLLDHARLRRRLAALERGGLTRRGVKTDDTQHD